MTRFIKTEISQENLVIEGDLDLRNTDITALPKNLVIEGYLDLRDTDITALPEKLTVEDDLDGKEVA